MLHVNLISWDNGVGLSRDLALLADALGGGGARVAFTRRGRGTWRKLGRPIRIAAQTAWQTLRGRGPRFDLNLTLEHVWPEYLPWAQRTAFIPNPEWCTAADLAALDRVALVLAKTREAERLFTERGVACEYIGFTSADRFDASVPRERAFFHLAGRSSNKGTQALLELWRRHPEWPQLTVVQSPRTAQPGAAAPNIRHLVEYLPDAELRRLQNAHRFHLCPSETEGFGHYLIEAMSVGALTVTLDAPPMNELVQADRGLLVAAAGRGRQHMATTYHFDPQAMADAIERALAFDAATLERYAAAARAWYLANDAAFAPRLREVVQRFAAERSSTRLAERAPHA